MTSRPASKRWIGWWHNKSIALFAEQNRLEPQAKPSSQPRPHHGRQREPVLLWSLDLLHPVLQEQPAEQEGHNTNGEQPNDQK